MKVLQVGKFYPPYMGGIETHLQALCGELRRVMDVHVLAAHGEFTTKDEIFEGVPVTRVGTMFTLASAPFCPAMVSRISASDADLVHIHLPNPTAILAYLASGHRGRLVVSYHSDIVRQKVLGRLFDPILQAALSRSSAIIVASVDYLQTSPTLSSFRTRCHIIPYGIRVEDFKRSDPIAVRHLRQQHGDRLILSVGRLVYYKGFEYLIRAMTKVHGRLLIVGDGPLRNRLQALAISLGIPDRVTFLGEIPNQLLSACYHATRLFVLPSVARSEAFGIVQLEAMACGKPVVNTSLDSGVPFVSLDGITGFTVPPADPDALARAINILLEDPALNSQFGEAARRRVEREFTLELMVGRVIHLYQVVLGCAEERSIPEALAQA